MTANEEYFDAALRHQVALRRFTEGEVRRLISILEEADRELVAKLRNQKAKLRRLDATTGTTFTTERLEELIKDVRALRAEAWKKYRQQLRGDVKALAVQEQAAELSMLQASIAPIIFDFATIDAATLRNAVPKYMFNGRTLKNWFDTLERSDRERLTQAIRLGIAQGEAPDNIIRRIAGTKANRFADGVLATTRREAAAVVRTAINGVSNRAREEFFEANESVIEALRWTATLDGVTTPVCRARDGHFVSINGTPLPPDLPLLSPEYARPPAHVNCRSIMVASVDGGRLLGERPFVRDSRTGDRRELDFRKQARREGRPVKEVRAEFARKNIGRVPAETTYQQWLSRQPASFQDDVLGKTKGALFRRGNLKLDKFVDRTGKELTLRELARQNPAAFIKANLDPEDFI